MKKNIFLAIMAGAALAGCVKNEEIVKNDSSPTRIAFDAPVVSIPTRATEIYGNYPGDKDFAVYALYHENQYDESSFTAANSSTYMANVKCVADNKTAPTCWAPEQAYYWPKNGYLTFAAYAPALTSGVDWDVNGFKFTDFTVNDTPANQIDLLYSERQYDKKKRNAVENQPYNGITIPFKHALSSIVFMAKTEADYTVKKDDDSVGDEKSTVIKLTGITVKNVAAKGTFKQNLLAAKTGDTDQNTDTDTDNEPAWDVNTTTYKSYEVYTSTAGSELTLNTTDTYVNGAVDGNDESYGSSNPPATPNGTGNVNNDGVRRSDLILIPQNLDRGDSDTDKVTVTINYTIKTGNADAVQQESTFQLAVAPKNESSSRTFVWEMGKRYIYHIVIGLDKIYFNPQVTNWEDAQGDAIQIK